MCICGQLVIAQIQRVNTSIVFEALEQKRQIFFLVEPARKKRNQSKCSICLDRLSNNLPDFTAELEVKNAHVYKTLIDQQLLTDAQTDLLV